MDEGDAARARARGAEAVCADVGLLTAWMLGCAAVAEDRDEVFLTYKENISCVFTPVSLQHGVQLCGLSRCNCCSRPSGNSA